MKTVTCIIVCFSAILFGQISLSSSPPPDPIQAYASPFGSFLVRVEPQDKQNGVFSTYLIRVLRYNSGAKRYGTHRKFLIESRHMPAKVLITEDGDTIVTINETASETKVHPAIMVYDGKGKLLKTGLLEDFLSKSEVENTEPGHLAVHLTSWAIDVKLFGDGIFIIREGGPKTSRHLRLPDLKVSEASSR